MKKIFVVIILLLGITSCTEDKEDIIQELKEWQLTLYIYKSGAPNYNINNSVLVMDKYKENSSGWNKYMSQYNYDGDKYQYLKELKVEMLFPLRKILINGQYRIIGYLKVSYGETETCLDKLYKDKKVYELNNIMYRTNDINEYLEALNAFKNYINNSECVKGMNVNPTGDY